MYCTISNVMHAIEQITHTHPSHSCLACAPPHECKPRTVFVRRGASPTARGQTAPHSAESPSPLHVLSFAHKYVVRLAHTRVWGRLASPELVPRFGKSYPRRTDAGWECRISWPGRAYVQWASSIANALKVFPWVDQWVFKHIYNVLTTVFCGSMSPHYGFR